MNCDQGTDKRGPAINYALLRSLKPSEEIPEVEGLFELTQHLSSQELMTKNAGRNGKGLLCVSLTIFA